MGHFHDYKPTGSLYHVVQQYYLQTQTYVYQTMIPDAALQLFSTVTGVLEVDKSILSQQLEQSTEQNFAFYL
jgi:hypothetical protein